MAIACALLSGVGLTGCSGGTTGNDIRGALTAIGSPIQSGPIGAWSNAWRKSNSATSLSFSPDGAQAGLTALSTGQAYFAAVDAPLTSADQSRTQASCGPDGAFSVPVSITSLGVAFNMPSIRGLRISPEVLAGIFSGSITRWNDSEIAAINPEQSLPSAPIVPITTPEPSAETLAATRYLARSPEWTGAPSAEWPKAPDGIEVKRYRDIAQKLDDTAGGIAVMDLASIGTRFDTALLSFGGDFVRLSKDSVTAAAQAGTTRELSTGVEFTLPEKTVNGYALGLVNYQAFCSTYKNRQLAALVRSWGHFVVGQDGQVASSYFANVASPSEAALKASAQRLERIREAS